MDTGTVRARKFFAFVAVSNPLAMKPAQVYKENKIRLREETGIHEREIPFYSTRVEWVTVAGGVNDKWIK